MPKMNDGNKNKEKKPSPDNVFDLTGGTSDEDDHEQDIRLGEVRKELEPPSGRKKRKNKRYNNGTEGLKTTGLADDVIVIADSDDSDNDDDDDDDIIEVDPLAAALAVSNGYRPNKKVKKEGYRKYKTAVDDDNNNNNNDECMIVPATKYKITTATAAGGGGNGGVNGGDDEDVVVAGVRNEMRLPHMRQHCTTFRFNSTGPAAAAASASFNNNNENYQISILEENNKSCDLCYCYICDGPVTDCKQWFSSTSFTSQNNHCCASDNNGKWESMRMRCRANKARSSSSSGDSNKNSGDGDDNNDHSPHGRHLMKDCISPYNRTCCTSCWCYICDTPANLCDEVYNHRYADPTKSSDRELRARRKLSTYDQDGPFDPRTTPDALQDPSLSQCRHCSWYVRLSTNHRRSSPSSADWCGACGRVAMDKDLEKQQQQQPTTSSTKGNSKKQIVVDSYFFGQKDIPFRIKAHDPRLFDAYKKNWEDNNNNTSEWNYDATEIEEEVFLHRVGKAPKLANLLQSISLVKEENIPSKPSKGLPFAKGRDIYTLRDATEAVIIDNPNHVQLISLLAGGQCGDALYNWIDVTASWDKDSRTGVLKVQLSLPKQSFLGNYNNSNINIRTFSPRLVGILGLWCNVLPLETSEICGLLKITEPQDIIDDIKKLNNYGTKKVVDIPIEPFNVKLDSVIPHIYNQLLSTKTSLMNGKNIYESQLSLNSSNNSRLSGGVCGSSSSFHDSLVRYFSEHFGSLSSSVSYRTSKNLISNSQGMIRRNHTGSDNHNHRHHQSTDTSLLDCVLGFQPAIYAQACFGKDSQKIVTSDLRSIKNTMISLENLGHPAEEFVEGLNVELLDFQRQSLRWALDRERNGSQSFHWLKVPRDQGEEDLYFNPVLKQFRTDKPALVRGGFICEEMGLGKTVISLALILKDPAPENPLSGSLTSMLGASSTSYSNLVSDSPGWDNDMYKKTSVDNKKRGSIISKGTLVICPVSLVGQWIEEAKSKLKNPGLIYPYHGGNRKRDPQLLSGNSIVVTTYDVIASDAFHHSKKGGKYYCPPLEQIRWWRIICDEGHSLRESNTKRSKAVLSLVADHKWIVSGTPINTDFRDLKNQLKFLGFEHVDKTMNSIYSSSGRSRGRVEADMQLLVFFLRPIMIRHAQGQTYRGTTTTLMSLPPKTERKRVVIFSKEERIEFEKIEKQAQDWYLRFRLANRKKMSKYSLKVSSKLLPLRIACSGGKYPIYDYSDDDEENGDGDGDAEDVVDVQNVDGNDGEEGGGKVKKKKSKETVYSKFSFNTKFNILLEELQKIRDKEPDSKSLVFSQFSATLNYLKAELPNYGFQFRSLSGDMSMNQRAKALKDFQNDPPTTIFLLSMRAGAVGINLTQANRIFLMEPSFNPALEAQAIGRCHRLGQKRPVETIRLIVKDSFEERMANFIEKKYGLSSGENVEDSNEENKDKKKSMDRMDNSKVRDLAGNLQTDKCTLVLEEFDALFGVEDIVLSVENSSDATKPEAGGGVKADKIISGIV